MGTKRCVNCMEEITEQVCPHCGYHEEDEQQAIYGLKRNTILHGKYLIGNVLGQGGFGITYIAFDIALEIKVAIKEYFPMGYVSRDCTRSNQLTWNNMQNGQEQLKKGGENFLKEARRMAKIDVLPEIVRVREVFMENQTSYIVMDYVEGETLKAWLLKNGTMGLSECMNMLLPLMNSLSEVHSFGLIHRDISPDNIMVLPNGRIRLLDLGAAKDLGIENNGSSQLVTKKGFSPIEQYMESGKIGTWTDVYALSATIYYCITGKMVPEAIERTITDTLNFDFPMKEKLSETAEETLRRGLAVKPEDRIQTVSEFARLLQGVETDNNVTETDNNVAETDNNVAAIDNNVAEMDNNVVETDTAPAEDPLSPVSGTEKEKDAETGHARDSVKINKKYKLAIAAVIIIAVAAVSVIAIRQKVSDSDVPSAKNADTIENEVEKVKVSDSENVLVDNSSMVNSDYHYILSGDVIKVGFAQVGHESDWRAANTKNYQDTFSAANGYELSFVDCDYDHAVQIETVRGFIEQELDYICIAPIQSAGWDTVLQEAQDAGIPVLIVDRAVDADASLYTTALGSDMVAEGETAGNWLAEYLNGEDANILVIEGAVGASATLGRTEGFNNIAAQNSNWKILDSQSGDFTQAGGQEVMESFIKSYSDFNVVVCQNDNEAYGAMDAMDAAGITYGVDGDVIIISFDATHDGLQYTLDGKITCNVEQNPLQAGFAEGVVQKLQAGEAVDAWTLVEDEAFVAPGIDSDYAVTMSQEVLDGRAY